jgi:hypothetical protein
MTGRAQNASTPNHGDSLIMDRFRVLASAMDGGEVKPIFRRFGDLSTLNLLVLQAELLELRTSLEAASIQDAEESHGYLATYSLGRRPVESVDKDNNSEKLKLKSDLLNRLREKLKEYSRSNNSSQMPASF